MDDSRERPNYQHQPSTSSESKEIRKEGRTKTPAEEPSIDQPKPKRQQSWKEALEGYPEPPPELQKDTTELTIFFELPVPQPDLKRVLISGENTSITVHDVIKLKVRGANPLADFVSSQLPKLSLITVRIGLQEIAENAEVKQELLQIFGQLVKIPSCDFKLEVDCGWTTEVPTHTAAKQIIDDEQKRRIKEMVRIVCAKQEVSVPNFVD